MTDNFLLEYRIQHTLHGSFHIFDCLIDDSVQTKIYTFLLSKLFCCCIRTNVKSDDDRVRCSCKTYVRFIDSTNTAMDYFYNYFFVGKLC